MPGIVALVGAISDHVVAALSAASAPPLTDGKILVGREHIAEASSPPRVVFIPTTGKYGPKSVASAMTVAATNERRLEKAQRSIASETVGFEVHVWGAAANDDPAEHYDATQALAQQVIRSVHELTTGVYALSDGRWTDGSNGGSNLIARGREYVFGISIATPILVEALIYAPSDVRPKAQTKLDPNDGSSTETGCSDP